MENNIRVSNLGNAIKLLKEKVILIAYPLNLRTIFRYKNNSIQCVNDKSSYCVNEYEFKEIFQNVDFFIYDEDLEVIDDEKDKEYYGWGKLSK